MPCKNAQIETHLCRATQAEKQNGGRLRSFVEYTTLTVKEHKKQVI